MASQLFEVKNGKIEWHPHEFQMQSWTSRARFPIVLKGWRGGYTSSSAKWLLNEMKRCGPGDLNRSYFAISPTHKVGGKGLLPAIETVFCTHYGFATYNKSEHVFTITPEGERALWGHAQKERTKIIGCYAEDPDSFASMTAIGGVADEICQKKFKHSAWTTLRARCSTASGMMAPNNRATGFPEGMKMGRILGGSTVYQLGWLEDLWNGYQRAVREAKAENDARIEAASSEAEKERLRRDFIDRRYYGEIHPELQFIRFDSTANPVFPPDEFDRMRLTLPEWFFDMRYRAIFRKPAGVIYEGFKPDHVIKRFPIPKNWEKMGAIDFGNRNFYATLWAHDADRDLHFLYDSYHRTDLDTTGHGAQLLEDFPDVDRWVAGQISEHDERAQLAAGGLGSQPPMFKPLWLGINNFNAAMRLNKIFIFEDVCRSSDGVNEFVEELRNYSRPVDEDTGDVIMDEDPEAKETYHWLDTARYYGTYHFAGLSTGEIKAAARSAEVQSGPSAKPREETARRELSDGVGIYAGGGMSQDTQTMRRYRDVYDPLM